MSKNLCMCKGLLFNELKVDGDCMGKELARLLLIIHGMNTRRIQSTLQSHTTSINSPALCSTPLGQAGCVVVAYKE